MPMRFHSFTLQGSFARRVNSLFLFARSTCAVALARVFRGPRLPSWPLEFEVATRFFKMQDAQILQLAARVSPEALRATVDSLVFRLPPLKTMRKTLETEPAGTWFFTDRAGPTILYFHGGGYALYPAMTDNIIALVASAAGGRTFIPRYRLAPEHAYPAQLDDAVTAYRWLMKQGIDPARLIVAGDSAGGHLAIALLLTLTAAGLPIPAAGVAISPWTDPQNGGASMQTNSAFDWMSPQMSEQLARWAGPELARARLVDWPDPSGLQGAAANPGACRRSGNLPRHDRRFLRHGRWVQAPTSAIGAGPT